MIGYCGCSNTWMTAVGAAGAGLSVWPKLLYGGGTVQRWAASKDGEKYWFALDTALATYGLPSGFWWELCAKEPTDPAAIEAAAKQVLPRLQQRLIGVPIFVSAINGYEPGFNSNVAAQDCQAAADALVAQGLVQRGPLMPVLGPTTTVSDKTHPNAAGRKLLGGAVKAFFG